MSDQVPLRCTCGKVRGVAKASPASGSRILCYCQDCQAFVHFLERGDVLDPHGGTDIFQMAPSAVSFSDGIEHVQCLRLSEKGMIRWYTDCCRTPIGNTIAASIPFIGLLDSFMDPKADGRSLDEVIGRPLGAIHGKGAVGGMPEGAHPTMPLGLIVRGVRLLAGWWLRGKGASVALLRRSHEGTARSAAHSDRRGAERSASGTLRRMHHAERQLVRAPGPEVFDVICAGEAVWKVAPADGRGADEPTLRVRPAGGAVHASLALARQGLRVGLATVLADDSRGRSLRDKVAAAGVDVGGVELARPSSALVFVRGGALQTVASAEEEPPVSVPEGWTSRVLLLSGVSPVLSHGAAFCKAARAARRTRTLVVVDVNARWALWQGRDVRNIRMVLREADVVSCSVHDLFGLNLDPAALRAVLRPSTVLVVSDGAGTARATGPFGEVTKRWAESGGMAPFGEGDAFTAAICSEIARVGHADERRGELWARALDRALTVAHTPR